jgi:hypothetical protein
LEAPSSRIEEEEEEEEQTVSRFLGKLENKKHTNN